MHKQPGDLPRCCSCCCCCALSLCFQAEAVDCFSPWSAVQQTVQMLRKTTRNGKMPLDEPARLHCKIREKNALAVHFWMHPRAQQQTLHYLLLWLSTLPGIAGNLLIYLLMGMKSPIAVESPKLDCKLPPLVVKSQIVWVVIRVMLSSLPSYVFSLWHTRFSYEHEYDIPMI